MTLTETRTALQRLGLQPSKTLGQNFLVDDNILRLIITQADLRPKDTVLEIGSGLGALTAALLAAAGHVTVIEKDRRLCAFLRERWPGLNLIAGDALALPLPAVDKVVANLPYSISTPILERLVETTPRPRALVLTLQREVAQRLAAGPRHKDYGALTLFTQLRYHVAIAHIVSPRCFYPAPRVESAVVVCLRREPWVPLAPGAEFHRLVRLGFQHRRKMLRKLVPDSAAILPALGVPATARAEELSLDQWISLANALR